MPDPPMLPTTCSANRSSLTEGAVHTNAFQVDLKSALQPLCQPATQRLQLSGNTDSWARGDCHDVGVTAGDSALRRFRLVHVVRHGAL